MAKVSVSQLHELGEQIKRRQIPEWKIPAVFGIVEDDPLGKYLRLVEEARQELISAEQVQALIEGKDETLGIFKVTVDYGLSFGQMIEAGRYDMWGGYAYYSSVRGEERVGQIERDLLCLNLGRLVTTNEVLGELDRRGLRPAKLQELLALGAARPELQKEFQIVALGSSHCGCYDLRYFPCLDSQSRDPYDLSRYRVMVRVTDRHWSWGHRFLAVRKDAV